MGMQQSELVMFINLKHLQRLGRRLWLKIATSVASHSKFASKPLPPLVV